MLKKTLALLGGLVVSIPAMAFDLPVTMINFNNETALEISSSVAGMPGHGIAANVSKPVPFGLIVLACMKNQTLNDCPIVFSDKSNGKQIAKIRMNASKASLNGAPEIEASYNNLYSVTGWETTPITNITIAKK